MLMDEPFKSLDLDLKASLIKSFSALWSMNQRSVFFVTHDIYAAMILGDDIFVLSEKPARIQKYIKNMAPFGERNLCNPDILEIEKQLYDHFFLLQVILKNIKIIDTRKGNHKGCP